MDFKSSHSVRIRSASSRLIFPSSAVLCEMACSSSENSDWYRATIGGLGLTGCILWADVQLRPIHGPYMDVETIKFGNLAEFAAVSKDASSDHEYSVAWIDGAAGVRKVGRGIFICGNHSPRQQPDARKAVHQMSRWKNVPFDLPSMFLNAASMRLFN